MNIRISSLLAVLALTTLSLSACKTDVEITRDDDAAMDTTAAMDTAETVVPTATAAKINLNTATAEEFMTIPGVGERMVGEFMEYRPYVSIQQFRQEIGKYVDEAQVAAYEEHVFVPIRPDESDAATLQQLPGVDESEAQQLADGRPYGSREAFLTRLGEFASPEEVQAAEQYLSAQ